MPSSWQEHFLEKLVAAGCAAGDERLGTATLHRRRRTASFGHPQLRQIECSFALSRKTGSQAQVLRIECRPKRGTEIDGAALQRELHDAGCGGQMHVDAAGVWFQWKWGFGPEAVFPIHNPRRVDELTRWTLCVVRLLLDHTERRRHVVTPSNPAAASSKPLDLRVTLEQYLEDLLAQQWETLPWAAELQYLDRQVECGSLGRIGRRRPMVQMTIDMPQEALAALRKSPQDFAREMRLAAAVKWYELALLSQERAASIAGLSRAEFLDALGRFGVSPFQYGAEEALEEAGRE